MCTLAGMMAEYGERRVEGEVLDWAHQLEDRVKSDALALTVAVSGVDGIIDLVLAGPALGGLSLDEHDELIAYATSKLTPVKLAA